MSSIILATGFHVLCAAVLEQALLDLQASSPKVRRDAWEWLTTFRRARLPFAEVCAVLNLDTAALQRLLDRCGRPPAAPTGSRKTRARTQLIASLRSRSRPE